MYWVGRRQEPGLLLAATRGIAPTRRPSPSPRCRRCPYVPPSHSRTPVASPTARRPSLPPRRRCRPSFPSVPPPHCRRPAEGARGQPSSDSCKQGLRPTSPILPFHISLFVSSVDLLLRRRRLSEQRCSGRSAMPSPWPLPSMSTHEESYDDLSKKDVESLSGRSLSSSNVTGSGLSSAGGAKGKSSWKLKSVVTLALTLLTSSQAILIVWSKRAGKYEYSVTTANFSVEALKCLLSLAALFRTWNRHGVTDDNRLTTSFDEVSVYPIPAILYMVKNLLQYYIFAYVDAPAYQILKNLNIISTGVLYRIILKKKLSEIQWAAFVLLCAGCTTAQLNPSSDHVLQTPIQGWMMAIIMALLSGFAGVYTEAIIKKRPSRNINVQNFWLYIFGVVFNLVAICVQDYDAVMNKGFFHGYSFITVLMILNHAMSGIAVSMVMKYADNIVKVYSTSVAMLLTAVVSVFLFSFHLSLPFFLGSTVVSVSVYLHSVGKLQTQK